MRRDVFQAIADPVRRDIIELLAIEPLTVNEVAERFDISRPAISKHLKILNECGVVLFRQNGRERICLIHAKNLVPAFIWLKQWRRPNLACSPSSRTTRRVTTSVSSSRCCGLGGEASCPQQASCTSVNPFWTGRGTQTSRSWTKMTWGYSTTLWTCSWRAEQWANYLYPWATRFILNGCNVHGI